MVRNIGKFEAWKPDVSTWSISRCIFREAQFSRKYSFKHKDAFLAFPKMPSVSMLETIKCAGNHGNQGNWPEWFLCNFHRFKTLKWDNFGLQLRRLALTRDGTMLLQPDTFSFLYCRSHCWKRLELSHLPGLKFWNVHRNQGIS